MIDNLLRRNLHASQSSSQSLDAAGQLDAIVVANCAITFFINVGIDHFLRPDFYLNIMPPNLPLHSDAVYLSGFLRFSAGLRY